MYLKIIMSPTEEQTKNREAIQKKKMFPYKWLRFN